MKKLFTIRKVFLKKLVLALFLVLFGAVAYLNIGKKYTGDSSFLFVNGRECQLLMGIPIPVTGTVRDYYNNGNTFRETPYRLGRRNGIYKEYYESGTVRQELHFKHGLPVGEAKNYYENGNIMEESFYKNDMGFVKTYYEDGKLKQEVPYKNDQKEGVQRSYYKNGELERELSFKQGRLDGLSKYYLPNRAGIEVQFSGDTAVSGYCVGQTGTKTPFTHPETVYLSKGLDIYCEGVAFRKSMLYLEIK